MIKMKNDGGKRNTDFIGLKRKRHILETFVYKLILLKGENPCLKIWIQIVHIGFTL